MDGMEYQLIEAVFEAKHSLHRVIHFAKVPRGTFAALFLIDQMNREPQQERQKRAVAKCFSFCNGFLDKILVTPALSEPAPLPSAHGPAHPSQFEPPCDGWKPGRRPAAYEGGS